MFVLLVLLHVAVVLLAFVPVLVCVAVPTTLQGVLVAAAVVVAVVAAVVAVVAAAVVVTTMMACCCHCCYIDACSV